MIATGFTNLTKTLSSSNSVPKSRYDFNSNSAFFNAIEIDQVFEKFLCWNCTNFGLIVIGSLTKTLSNFNSVPKTTILTQTLLFNAIEMDKFENPYVETAPISGFQLWLDQRLAALILLVVPRQTWFCHFCQYLRYTGYIVPFVKFHSRILKYIYEFFFVFLLFHYRFSFGNKL